MPVDRSSLQEEAMSDFSPRARWARELVVYIIIGIMAIKFTVIPFINHLDASHGTQDRTLSNSDVVLVQSGNNMASLKQLGSSEIFGEMDTVHTVDMLKLMQKHSVETKELRLQLASAVAAKEAAELLLKTCEANFETEQARVDMLLKSLYFPQTERVEEGL
jgi:hypothetical protein